jgi:hypothetical protein
MRADHVCGGGICNTASMVPIAKSSRGEFIWYSMYYELKNTQGGSDDGGRLGLLAAAITDGRIGIYTVPKPSRENMGLEEPSYGGYFSDN